MGGAAPGRAAEPARPLLRGKSVLVVETGTSGSLPRDIGDALSAAGADVSLAKLNETSEAAWGKALAAAARPARVDVIVNVSVPDRGGVLGTIALPEFRRIVEGTYGRTFFALKHGGEFLRQSGGGLFVNVTSADAMHGAPSSIARCAAANGIVVMTKSAALEFAALTPSVRVNALLVGDVVRGKPAKVAPGQVSAQDVGAAVCYLAADASIYLTGLILPVDNGGGPT
jgi:hypothetical protein